MYVCFGLLDCMRLGKSLSGQRVVQASDAGHAFRFVAKNLQVAELANKYKSVSIGDGLISVFAQFAG